MPKTTRFYALLWRIFLYNGKHQLKELLRRSESLLNSRVYRYLGDQNFNPLSRYPKKYQVLEVLPLTNTLLSGNLVIDNLCRLDKGKLPPQSMADAPSNLVCGVIRGRKAMHPSINSEGIDAGNGKLPEVLI